MPQVSKRKLDSDLESAIENQLWSSITKISDIPTAYQFFSDLLTKTEKVMLSKRIACAILLIRGKSASSIKNCLNVTYSTIGTVSAWVKNAKPKTRNILLQFSKEKDWENITDRIDELLDKLPPAYGSDWSRASRSRRRRTYIRSTRKLLR